MRQPTLAHRDPRLEIAYYRENGICEVCGSMLPELAIHYLTLPGTKFAGSDWTKGFPEKFYITPFDSTIRGHRTFHVMHLMDATDEVFKRFDEISRQVFGVAWFREEAGIRFNSPRSNNPCGFQRHGIIGADGQPQHQDGMNTDQILRLIDESEEKIAANRAGQKVVNLPAPEESPQAEV